MRRSGSTRPAPGDRRAERGLSAVEVIMMAAVMSVLMIMITESMATLSSVRNEQRAGFRLADVADSVARRIEKDARYAIRVFTDAPADMAWYSSLALDPRMRSLGQRLPRLTDSGFFEPDGTARETGNVLFVASRLPKVEIELASARRYRLQCLRFVVYAPVLLEDRLELMQWTSETLVDYWDVVDIADPADRAEALARLHEDGVRYAWDTLAPRATGLWELLESGELELVEPEETIAGREDPAHSRPFAERAMQLAANGSLATIDVPAFGNADGMFPGGLEVKVDGAAAGKLLLLRMVTSSTQDRLREVANEVRRCLPTNG